MEAVRPDADALMADFTNRWGDGSNILEYKEGKRRQPQKFKWKQVYATALDPRAKHLYRIQQQERAGVRRAVDSAAVDIALGKHAGNKAPASTEKPASDPVQTQPASLGGGQGAPKRPRMSAFEAAAAAHAGDAGDSSAGDLADEKREQLLAMVDMVDMEVSAFKAAPGIRVWDM